MEKVLLPQRDTRLTVFSILGIGGVGKSQLALHSTYRHLNHFNPIFWVTTETSIKITQAFEEIGTEVGLLEPDGAKRARRLLFTKRKGGCGTMVRISECTIAMMMADFGEDKPFLLPFDIIESMSILKNYLPASGRASVMITTKSQNLFQPPGTAWAHLKCFDMEEGKHYLLTNIPRNALDGNEAYMIPARSYHWHYPKSTDS